MNLSRARSPWVLHYDASSCNGCDIETVACMTPLYDIERFGAISIGCPKHADILLVTGTINHKSLRVLRNIYEQMTEPKVVAAIGICATSGGVFHQSYNLLGGVDKAIPVDVYISGCPPRPEAIIDAIVMGVEKLKKKGKEGLAGSAEASSG
ncbi:MAG: NADH-quinone oxidoreductase subunit NuoB [Syntrophomonadaceae bacterium]|nr:NADH-quinone oxidoreductase subunit NuoB [Syntrophomonadaceae bacterium]